MEQCELRTVMCAREKCASARVQVGVVSTHSRRTHGCCYWLSAKLRFSNFCRKNGTGLQSDLPVEGDNVDLVVCACCFQLQSENVSSTLSYFTIVLPICRLATRAGPISANFESMKTTSTMLGLVTSLKMMMMVVGVLNFAALQIVSSNSYSTIPGTLVMKGQSLFC